jgi:hypothetical protein
MLYQRGRAYSQDLRERVFAAWDAIGPGAPVERPAMKAMSDGQSLVTSSPTLQVALDPLSRFRSSRDRR